MNIGNITQGSWKTTSAGITMVVGALVHLYFKRTSLSEEDITITLVGLLAGVGLIVARDNNKTSEQVGAAAPPTPPAKTP